MAITGELCNPGFRYCTQWCIIYQCIISTHKFNHYFRSKCLSIPHKIGIFKAYVETTLLYNSETWALTATLEESLNSFHRRILRIAINIRYPKKISSKNLYILTKETPISDRIRKRRIALFGHVLRLHPDTPAQKALQFHIVPRKRPVGHPHATWLALITKAKTSRRHYNTTTSNHPSTKTQYKNLLC